MISPERYRRACSMVLHAAVQSAESGKVREYFVSEAEWEADMRQRFAQTRAGLLTGDDAARGEAIELLGYLNGVYRTRFPPVYVPAACNAILGQLPPNMDTNDLFGCSGGQAAAIAEIVPRALAATWEVISTTAIDPNKRPSKPYSLTTKFLHFLFPELFVIYDAQAWASVWMWGLFAIDEEGENPEIQPFGYDLSATSGSGYAAMFDFYRGLWQSCADTDRERARKAAASLEVVLRLEIGCELARVTVIDLIDKLLWKADGNPFRLGLVAIPG
jgi:hypothetical protein